MNQNWHLPGAIVIAMLFVALNGFPAVISAGNRHGCHCCPECEHTICVPTPVTEKVSRHCWGVDCKVICIPAIKWPWQSCCEPPQCGRAKTVKVLKKVELECQKCGYQWDVKCVPCCD